MPHSVTGGPVPDAHAIASAWLSDFAKPFEAGDVEGILPSILPNGWFRDILIFTWDNRTARGHDAIRAFLAPKLPNAKISNIRLDDRQYFKPTYGSILGPVLGVVACFLFETPIAKGQGCARLMQDGEGKWKAISVFLMMQDLKGHEEMGPESGVYGGHTIPWHRVKAERFAKIESDPQVIIVGAGQTGLNIGARFKQMGIRTIIIEKNNRVGDVWRKRYPTLVLHTPRPHHSLIYQNFPDTWPTFTPRDKLADFLEQYAVSQDLLVWTNSTIEPTPKYDPTTGRWTCTILRNGTPVTLTPAHIVLAAGTLGAPNVPDVPTMPEFKGEIFHAQSFQGAEPFAGKKVVVVGAGNTAADICQDSVTHGAKSVLMVQRSDTAIVSGKKTELMLLQGWPIDVPCPVSDFMFSSIPWGMKKEFLGAAPPDPNDMDNELWDGVEAKGLKVADKGGHGQFLLVFERFGGYWLDVGCADLIRQDKVGVKQGVEIASFTSNTVVFTDGSEVEADVVVFGTGYRSILESFKTLFGEEVISKTPVLWGFDHEQELRGCYRPSGQPGLWYGAGDFYNSRFMSKQLALQIKAIELGYNKQ